MNEKYTINISFFEKNLLQNTQLSRNLLQYNSLPYNKIQCFAVDSVDFSWFFSRARASPCMRVREIVSLFEFIFPFWIHWWARRRGADLISRCEAQQSRICSFFVVRGNSFGAKLMMVFLRESQNLQEIPKENWSYNSTALILSKQCKSAKALLKL